MLNNAITASSAQYILLLALWALSSLTHPVGLVEDDALHILLARGLWDGAFALDGKALTDPLPGFAALLMLPARLLEPNWEALRWLNLPLAVLALRGLRSPFAAVATLCTPVFIERLGLVTPDIAFVAAAVWALAAKDWRVGGGAAGAAMLLRPQGLALLPALLFKDKRAAAVSAVAPALWHLRGRFAGGYVDNLASQASQLADPAAWLGHLHALLRACSEGMTGLPWLWLPLFALAARGAWLRARKGEAAPLVFCAGVLVMQQLWLAVEPRYVLPIAPFLWLYIAENARLHWAAGLLLLPASFGRLAPGLKGQQKFQPRSMAWIKENTPRDAVFETLEPRTLTLLTGRKAQLPPFDPRLETGATHGHVDLRFTPGGWFPEQARELITRGRGRRIYAEPAEGVEVFDLRSRRKVTE